MALLLGCAEIDPGAPTASGSDSSNWNPDSAGSSESDSEETGSEGDLPSDDDPTDRVTDSDSEWNDSDSEWNDSEADSEQATDLETDSDTASVNDTGSGGSGLVECNDDNAAEVCGDAALCSDGYCCDRPCHGACEACHLEGHEGTCQYLSSEIVCRQAANSCDLPESCTGQEGECPIDLIKPAGEICRPSEGECDLPEKCAGDGSPCPEDVFEANNVVCRQPVDLCDKGELCPGDGPDCPVDVLFGKDAVCRPKVGECDVAAEYCTGESAACPPDTLQPSGTLCRGIAGVCDQAEHCNGTSPYCPLDTFKNAGVLCRPGTSGCDVSEFCSGLAPSCPDDAPGTVTYTENFDSADLPEGWEIIDGDGDGFEADGATWEYATATPPGNGEGGYWIANSDECVCRMSDSLLTRLYDLTDCGTVEIQFEHEFVSVFLGYPDEGYVMITYDEEEWFIIGEYSLDSSGLQSGSWEIGENEELFRLKFLYDSDWGYWWKIDEVKIVGRP